MSILSFERACRTKHSIMTIQWLRASLGGVATASGSGISSNSYYPSFYFCGCPWPVAWILLFRPPMVLLSVVCVELSLVWFYKMNVPRPSLKILISESHRLCDFILRASWWFWALPTPVPFIFETEFQGWPTTLHPPASNSTMGNCCTNS